MPRALFRWPPETEDDVDVLLVVHRNYATLADPTVAGYPGRATSYSDTPVDVGNMTGVRRPTAVEDDIGMALPYPGFLRTNPGIDARTGLPRGDVMAGGSDLYVQAGDTLLRIDPRDPLSTRGRYGPVEGGLGSAAVKPGQVHGMGTGFDRLVVVADGVRPDGSTVTATGGSTVSFAFSPGLGPVQLDPSASSFNAPQTRSLAQGRRGVYGLAGWPNTRDAQLWRADSLRAAQARTPVLRPSTEMAPSPLPALFSSYHLLAHRRQVYALVEDPARVGGYHVMRLDEDRPGASRLQPFAYHYDRLGFSYICVWRRRLDPVQDQGAFVGSKRVLYAALTGETDKDAYAVATSERKPAFVPHPPAEAWFTTDGDSGDVWLTWWPPTNPPPSKAMTWRLDSYMGDTLRTSYERVRLFTTDRRGPVNATVNVTQDYPELLNGDAIEIVPTHPGLYEPGLALRIGFVDLAADLAAVASLAARLTVSRPQVRIRTAFAAVASLAARLTVSRPQVRIRTAFAAVASLAARLTVAAPEPVVLGVVPSAWHSGTSQSLFANAGRLYMGESRTGVGYFAPASPDTLLGRFRWVGGWDGAQGEVHGSDLALLITGGLLVGRRALSDLPTSGNQRPAQFHSLSFGRAVFARHLLSHGGRLYAILNNRGVAELTLPSSGAATVVSRGTLAAGFDPVDTFSVGGSAYAVVSGGRGQDTVRRWDPANPGTAPVTRWTVPTGPVRRTDRPGTTIIGNLAVATAVGSTVYLVDNAGKLIDLPAAAL